MTKDELIMSLIEDNLKLQQIMLIVKTDAIDNSFKLASIHNIILAERIDVLKYIKELI